MDENIKRVLRTVEKSYEEIRKESDTSIRLGRLEGLVEFVIMYTKEQLK